MDTAPVADTMGMEITESLCNHFLIAMPALADPNFHHTATYICEHNEDGALGVIINRPLGLQLGDILQHMDIGPYSDEIATTTIYMGGPIQSDRGFVLHEALGNWEATLKVTDTMGVTSSSDILKAIAAGTGPQNYLITLGYAGWAPGQLEHEIVDNAWLNGEASTKIVFDTPDEQRWEAAAAQIGVDLSKISVDVGHA